VKIHKAFRYRVYPTPEQEARLEAWEHSLRFLWNLAHEQRLLGLARPLGERCYYTAFDQMKQLTGLRAELLWLADVPYDVSAQLLVELDKAWKCCFSKQAKQPRWKHKNRSSVTMCESHQIAWRLADKQIRFPKLGWLRAVVHRPLEGVGKTCSLTREGDQWFASIVCEITVSDPTPPLGEPIALDRGVINLVADSDGNIIKNPRSLKRSSKRLARAQRVVSRRKRGSKNQKKARSRVMRIHRKIRRQRDWFLHQVSNRYAKKHGTVIIEKLQVRSMTRSAQGTLEHPGTYVQRKAGLNRSILDSSWGKLRWMLRYKNGWAGGSFIEVPAAYSSQTCAQCDHVAAENRQSQSVFVCAACGHQAHADTNAAKVLLSRGVHGGAACGGSAAGRPVKQELCVARH